MAKLELCWKNKKHELYLSAASCGEIAIKFALGKIDLPEKPREYVPKRLRVMGIHSFPIHQQHALSVAELPTYHDDPFDRILIAQAKHEEMVFSPPTSC